MNNWGAWEAKEPKKTTSCDGLGRRCRSILDSRKEKLDQYRQNWMNYKNELDRMIK